MEPGWLSRPGPTRRRKGRPAGRDLAQRLQPHRELARYVQRLGMRGAEELRARGWGRGRRIRARRRLSHAPRLRPVGRLGQATKHCRRGESTAAAQGGARRRAAGGQNPTSKQGAGERHHTGWCHRPAAREAAIGGTGPLGAVTMWRGRRATAPSGAAPSRPAPHNRLGHRPRGFARSRARHQRARREPIDTNARLHRAPGTERHRSLACGGRKNGTNAMLNQASGATPARAFVVAAGAGGSGRGRVRPPVPLRQRGAALGLATASEPRRRAKVGDLPFSRPLGSQRPRSAPTRFSATTASLRSLAAQRLQSANRSRAEPACCSKN